MILADLNEILDKINERYLAKLTEQDLMIVFDKVKNIVDFGDTDVKQFIILQLLDLHSTDEDFACNEFYSDVQERLDELLMSQGREPLKDKAFNQACEELLFEDKIEKLSTLNHETNKVRYGYRLSLRFVTRLNDTAANLLKKYIADNG